MNTLEAQLEEAQRHLAAFHAALERERGAGWEKQHMDLADRLENPNSDRTVMLDDCRDAARQLRYMATSFTHKANFVPAELRIKELEKQVAQLRDAIAPLPAQLNVWLAGTSELKAIEDAIASTPSPDFIHKRELLPTIELLKRYYCPTTLTYEATQKEIKRLEQLTKQEPTQ